MKIDEFDAVLAVQKEFMSWTGEVLEEDVALAILKWHKDKVLEARIDELNFLTPIGKHDVLFDERYKQLQRQLEGTGE